MKLCMVQGNDENTYGRETLVLRKKRLVSDNTRKISSGLLNEEKKITLTHSKAFYFQKKQKEV